MIDGQQLKKQEVDVEAILQKQANSSIYTEKQSSFRERYEQIIGERLGNPINICDFQADNVAYNPSQFQPNFKISIIQRTANYEVLKISIKYGYFQCLVAILNTSINSPSQQLSVEESGCYGRVFRARFKKYIIAIKSIRLTEQNFENVFIEAVKEYFLLKVASLLKAAPFVMDIYGFNLVIFKNAIEFSMEMCSLQTINSQSAYESALSDLNQSLHRFHFFKIVHNDIKPKNIAFSPTYGSYVFLDFGLSQIVKEDVGKLTQTAFVGSIQFCSKEMRDLYITGSDGWIDLYYNDANSFQNTLERIRSDIGLALVNSKQGKYVFCQDSYKFYEAQLLIFIKFALYTNQIFTNLQNSFFIENQDFCRLHDRELKQFIFTLPQTYTLKNLWSIYMKEAGDFESKETYFSRMSIKNQGQGQQNISELVFSRFNTISQIELRKSPRGILQTRKGQTIYFLFNSNVVKLFTFDSYLKVFVQFIKINGDARNQEEKILACKVFNKLYLNEQKATPQILYYNIITYIWEEVTNSFTQERYKILISIIQTVVILEILSQEALHAAFTSIFVLNGPNFIQKCIAAFVFISSLEFSKAKLKTKYQQNTFQRFLEELGQFMKKNYENAEVSEREILIFKLLCQLIAITLESQDYLNLQCVQKKCIFSNCYQMFLSYFLQQIKDYIQCLSFTLSISSFNNFWNKRVTDILAIINMNSNRFSYMHFPLFQVSLIFNEEYIQSNIYEVFCHEFTWLGIHQHFQLYFYYKLNTLQNRLIKRRLEFLNNMNNSQETNTDLAILNEIFNLVRQKDNKQNTTCKLLCLVYETDVITFFPSFNSMIVSFVKQNQEDLDNLISEYSESNKDYHVNTLKKYIQIIGSIKLNHVKLLPKGEGRKVLQKYTQTCLTAISKIKCFECKASCLLQLKIIIFHRLTLQEKTEQSLYLLVDCLSFAMKYSSETNLILAFIEYIIAHTQLPYTRQTDFQDLVYCILKYHKKFIFCFKKIKNYNIFVHIYIHVYNHYPEQEMFHFMTSIFSILNQICSSQNRQFFYRSMEIIMKFISEHQQQQKQLFQIYNETLNVEFKKQANPYVSLYCISLLQLKKKGEFDNRVLFNIARYINLVDATTRRIILSSYFYYFAYFLPNSQRKCKYLLNKHTTYSFNKFPPKFLYKQKIKAKTNDRTNKQFYYLLRRSLLLFHKNTGNIIE